LTGKIRVLVWNENVDEKRKPNVLEIYADGIHGAIASALSEGELFDVRIATMDEPDCGLSQERLSETDVIVWWSHRAYDEVPWEIVDRVQKKVLGGTGLIVLHSAHFSRLFKSLMGTTCDLKWREAGENERLWVVSPGHPIAEGLGEYIDLSHEEMYGEPFDVPVPDEIVFVSWFKGGEIFRSGCCYQRGKGRIFYFRPGHEDYPTYLNADVRKVLRNAVRWAAPVQSAPMVFGNHQPLEKLDAQRAE